MLSYVVVCAAALVVAAVTLFSGFGLGTLLMPVFAIFFPVQIAIAATAVVHLANNLFKLALIGKWADWAVVLRFALPAAAAAVLGAAVLTWLPAGEPLAGYELLGRQCDVTLVKLVVAVLIAAFTLLELLPGLREVTFERKYIPLGGLLSGFFGGLSGHQGALRSAFLIRAGLPKERFLGTVVVAAVVVDVARLIVYGAAFLAGLSGGEGRAPWPLLAAATAAAFAGSFLASRYAKKVTMEAIHVLVGVMLLLMAAALGAGLV